MERAVLHGKTAGRCRYVDSSFVRGARTESIKLHVIQVYRRSRLKVDVTLKCVAGALESHVACKVPNACNHGVYPTNYIMRRDQVARESYLGRGVYRRDRYQFGVVYRRTRRRDDELV